MKTKNVFQKNNHDSTVAMSNLDTLSAAIKAACLAYVIWLPVSAGQILYPTLILLAAASTFDILRTQTRLERPFVLGILLLSLSIAFGLAVGTLVNAPGILHQTLVWAGGMSIWGLWTMGLKYNQLRLTFHITVGAIGLISALMSLYTLGELGYLPALIPSEIIEGQAAGIGEDATGATAFRFLSLSSLAAGAPLALSMAMVPGNKHFPHRRWLLLVTALSLIAVVLSGRRAILGVTLLTPAILFATYVAFGRLNLTSIIKHRVIAPSLVAAGAILVTVLSISSDLRERIQALWADTLASFLGIGSIEVVAGFENRARVKQAGELLAAWSDSPLIGNGIGSVLASGFSRSQDRPWMFELQYHLWLANSGILGVGIGLFGLWLIFGAVRRTASIVSPADQDILAVTLTAAICLFIANATNPYLQAIGHWWGVALIFGVSIAIWSSRDYSLSEATRYNDGNHRKHIQG